jgi:acetyl esterase
MFLSFAASVSFGQAQNAPAPNEPVAHVYETVNGREMKLYVFAPGQTDGGPRAALVAFHGGGWNAGDAEWTFSQAERFARLGMVGISVDYRLSDGKNVTPLEAVADARESVRWIRRHASELGIYPNRIAVFGVSAGGHLAVATAMVDDSVSKQEFSSVPNALLLYSPALDLGADRYFQKLLGARADAKKISPDENVRPGFPPAIIFNGDADTMTPISGAQRFCDRMKRSGNRCELHVYKGLGHLLTPADADPNGPPAADPKARADAYRNADEFLISLGYISKTAETGKKESH